MPKRPFDLLRACFYLLAFVVVIEMLATIVGGLLCWYGNMTQFHQPNLCLSFDQIVKEIWGEVLTAVLALLAAGRIPPSNKDDEK